MSAEKPGLWRAGGVVALLLGISHNRVIHMSLKGKIRRRLQRVSHAQRAVHWYYNMEDVAVVRQKLIEAGEVTDDIEKMKDPSGKYVSAQHAAQLLYTSVTTVFELSKGETRRIDGLRIRRKEGVQFTFPIKRKRTGYVLADVLALKLRRERNEAMPAYMEETVTRSTIEVALAFDTLKSWKINDLLESHERGILTADEVVSNIRNVLRST